MEADRSELPKLLSNCSKKLFSLFFRKLVMFEESNNEEDVKHYDLECQGVIMIEAILKKKIQVTQMKALQEIKSISKFCESTSYRRYKNNKSREYYESSIYSRENTLRPYIVGRNYPYQQTVIQQDSSFINQSVHHSLYPQSPIKDMQNDSKYFGYGSSHSSNRVRFANPNQSKLTPNIDQSSYELPNHKDLKRRMIIEKLNNIQRDILEISTIDETYSHKSSMVRPFGRQAKNQKDYPTRRFHDIY